NTSSAALIHRQPERPVGRASVVSCLVPRCFSFRHTNSGSARACRTEYDENPTSKQQLAVTRSCRKQLDPEVRCRADLRRFSIRRRLFRTTVKSYTRKIQRIASSLGTSFA